MLEVLGDAGLHELVIRLAVGHDDQAVLGKWRSEVLPIETLVWRHELQHSLMEGRAAHRQSCQDLMAKDPVQGAQLSRGKLGRALI